MDGRLIGSFSPSEVDYPCYHCEMRPGVHIMLVDKSVHPNGMVCLCNECYDPIEINKPPTQGRTNNVNTT